MSDFNFLRPLWLAAIPALFLIIYLLKKQQFSQSGWQQFIPEHLSKVLIDGQSGKNKRPYFSALFTGILAIIALAGPTWQKLPQPVFQLQQGSVLIMDMSYSMYSTDISPNRLTRSRYKASDLLSSINEGEIGLIAYAGDAFNISPLTKDINNIKLLLDSLSPDIMPVAGSNPLAALAMADEMLINAGHVNGHIYWLTDGIDSGDLQDITQWSRQHPHRLNVLGIGTKAGAPIKLPNGELLKDNTGAIVVPKLSINKLYGAAQSGRGVYQTISTNASDINALVDYAKNEESNTDVGVSDNDSQGNDTNNDLVRGDKWHEVGPWLILLVLPFVLFAFRRGVLFGLALTISYLPSPQVSANVWDDLWKTDNQQAQEKFSKENYQGAAQQFNNPQWQGSAHYKNGDYEEALASFKQSDTAEAFYNQGNSYAQLQQLDKAIDAYETALEKDPNLEQAKENKALIEKLKQQQEQQQSENGESDSNEQDQDNQENQQQDGDQQGDSQDNQNGEQQQSQDQSQEQSQDQGEKSSENDSQSDPENNSQNDENSDAQNSEDEEKNKSDSDETSDKESESEQESQAAEADQGENEGNEEAKTAAQLAEEQKAKETEQKHQQLLNKVTNDPYLLLRNKMQLEYQKRRHEQSSIGEKKKW